MPLPDNVYERTPFGLIFDALCTLPATAPWLELGSSCLWRNGEIKGEMEKWRHGGSRWHKTSLLCDMPPPLLQLVSRDGMWQKECGKAGKASGKHRVRNEKCERINRERDREREENGRTVICYFISEISERMLARIGTRISGIIGRHFVRTRLCALLPHFIVCHLTIDRRW